MPNCPECGLASATSLAGGYPGTLWQLHTTLGSLWVTWWALLVHPGRTVRQIWLDSRLAGKRAKQAASVLAALPLLVAWPLGFLWGAESGWACFALITIWNALLWPVLVVVQWAAAVLAAFLFPPFQVRQMLNLVSHLSLFLVPAAFGWTLAAFIYLNALRYFSSPAVLDDMVLTAQAGTIGAAFSAFVLFPLAISVAARRLSNATLPPPRRDQPRVL